VLVCLCMILLGGGTFISPGGSSRERDNLLPYSGSVALLVVFLFSWALVYLLKKGLSRWKMIQCDASLNDLEVEEEPSPEHMCIAFFAKRGKDVYRSVRTNVVLSPKEDRLLESIMRQIVDDGWGAVVVDKDGWGTVRDSSFDLYFSVRGKNRKTFCITLAHDEKIGKSSNKRNRQSLLCLLVGHADVRFEKTNDSCVRSWSEAEPLGDDEYSRLRSKDFGLLPHHKYMRTLKTFDLKLRKHQERMPLTRPERDLMWSRILEPKDGRHVAFNRREKDDRRRHTIRHGQIF